MKVKKIIFGLIITLLVLIIGIGENIVLATGETTKTLCLSYARYVYDGTDFVKKGAYAVSNGHNIYQIMDTSTNMPLKNIYCLDAPTSYTWNYQIDDTGEIKEESGNINTPATYNRSYNMVKDNDIIKKLAVTNYNKVNNSKYYGQILWLLDNAYVEGTDKNKNESGSMFIDIRKPEIKYKYSSVENTKNPIINYESKNVTVVFDVIDKYYKGTKFVEGKKLSNQNKKITLFTSQYTQDDLIKIYTLKKDAREKIKVERLLNTIFTMSMPIMIKQ